MSKKMENFFQFGMVDRNTDIDENVSVGAGSREFIDASQKLSINPPP